MLWQSVKAITWELARKVLFLRWNLHVHKFVVQQYGILHPTPYVLLWVVYSKPICPRWAMQQDFCMRRVSVFGVSSHLKCWPFGFCELHCYTFTAPVVQAESSSWWFKLKIILVLKYCHPHCSVAGQGEIALQNKTPTSRWKAFGLLTRTQLLSCQNPVHFQPCHSADKRR